MAEFLRPFDIRAVPGEHDDYLVAAVLQRAADGDGIGGPPVEIQPALKPDHRGKERDGGGRAQHLAFAADIGLLAEVDGFAGAHIGHPRHKFARGSEERLVIEGIQVLGHDIEDEIHPEHGSGFEKILQADIPFILEIIHVHTVGTAFLPGHIADAVASPGRHANHVIRQEIPVHQAVEHPDGVQAAHAAAFEHQSDFQSRSSFHFVACVFVSMAGSGPPMRDFAAFSP